MKRVFGSLFLMMAACTAGQEASGSEASHQEVAPSPALAAAMSIVGHYTGTSMTYGLDEANEVVPKGSFTEDITAEGPRVEDGKAFVTVTDVMSTVSHPVQWTEGFFIKPDGSVGDRYFEIRFPGIPPIVTVEKALAGGDDAMTFETDVAPPDYDSLGFTGRNVVYKKHTWVKNVVRNGNVERDMLSRMTTVSWKDAAGVVQTKTFVSLNGFQERTLSH